MFVTTVVPLNSFLKKKMAKKKAKAKAKKWPQKKGYVRSIYGVGDNGKKTLLYRDEIVYDVPNQHKLNLMHVFVYNDAVEMMNSRIKLEITEGKN